MISEEINAYLERLNEQFREAIEVNKPKDEQSLKDMLVVIIVTHHVPKPPKPEDDKEKT